MSGLFRVRSDTPTSVATRQSDSPDDLLKKLQMPKPIAMLDEAHQPALSGSRSEPSLLHPAMIPRSHSCSEVPCKKDSVDEMFLDATDMPGLDLEDLVDDETQADILEDGTIDRRVSPLTRALTDQAERDRLVRGVRPNLATNFEMTPAGKQVKLTKMIGSSVTSVIYETSSKVVVKYQVDCFDIETDKIHPLLKDYSFLKRLSGLSVAPEVYYLSAQTRMVPTLWLKTRFSMSMRQRLACADHGGMVRFMMLEKLGSSVHNYRSRLPGQRVPFAKSIELAVHLIDLMRTLHDRGGVVQGDIHGGNICFAEGPVNGNPLRVIDFGRASFVASPDDDLMDQVRTPFKWTNALNSHWNMRGLRETRRDDVFKTLMLISTFIYGEEYFDAVEALTVDKAFEFKASMNIFTIPNSVIPKPYEQLGLSDQSVRKISELFNEIVGKTRRTAIDERPNYEEIINKFSMINAELHGSSP